MGRELSQGEVVQKAHDLIDKSQHDVNINREFESLSPQEQLKVAREATKYQKEQYPDLPLVVFGGMESGDPAVAQITKAGAAQIDKELHPERQAKRIEEAGAKKLAGEAGADGDLKREVDDLQRQTPEYRSNVIEQVARDGNNHNPFNAAPHAEVEYRKDANGNPTSEPDAIVFSKNFGLPVIGSEERVDFRREDQKDADQLTKIQQQKEREDNLRKGAAPDMVQVQQYFHDEDRAQGRLKEPCTPDQNRQQKGVSEKEQTCTTY